MDEYRSIHLQKNLGDVLASAEVAPTVLVNRGQPRLVLMSVGEFRRLKELAGEPVPAAAMPRLPLTVRGRVEDRLGYDTSDLYACAREMAEAALSGRNAAAVETELARVRARFAKAPSPEPRIGKSGA
ncbi:type II toxin-antitoxin system Phd/YefM family antitoxin [Acidisphaera sp. S103]|uniref:type II toxin-antitoxin system Phd/YefM family antitoxin n=1 Tax=Acidisphaera sp. S103 TaxID=1747223 RepID=UPI00131E9931|nr:type II toxin-antitoxin system Phd/YefM family antitoxin [Acidisphaera sp. S103]